MKKKIFKFDNSYIRELPSYLYTELNPTAVQKPEIACFNQSLADELEINFSEFSSEEIAQILSGNILPDGAHSTSLAYAGHQFGHFTILGDGRAHLIGEHLTSTNHRYDIQLKGSGRTPYSRQGDGKAALGPMLREYIMSEAIYALNIPTTRSLAVVKTGHEVIRDEILEGAILTRIAKSHLRVGTFEFVASQQDVETLKILTNYALKRHYGISADDCDNPAIQLLKLVSKTQADLIVNWMRVGFIHGVMNTDNITISGETIDYGPCAFMDHYDPKTVFSYIDSQRRYAYGNQPYIAQWNIARLAEALLPLLNDNQSKAIDIAETTIDGFGNNLHKKWFMMMSHKIGLEDHLPDDEKIITDLLGIMEKNKLDYTNTFVSLSMNNVEVWEGDMKHWYSDWLERIKKQNKPVDYYYKIMQKNNPFIIPRNHLIEKALFNATEADDYSFFNKLTKSLLTPYDPNSTKDKVLSQPNENSDSYVTYCGT